jgi:hypothetical protein
MRGVGGFFGAPIVMTIRTATMACTPTLATAAGRTAGRACAQSRSSNRIDMCRQN